MTRSLWLVAAISVPLSCAGMCGSVIQGYHPVGWANDTRGGWISTAGDFEVYVGGLVERGTSYGRIEIKNLGAEKARLMGIELTIGDATLQWEPVQEATILPGGAYTAEPSWNQEIHIRNCEVVLRIKIGANSTTIRIPFART